MLMLSIRGCSRSYLCIFEWQTGKREYNFRRTREPTLTLNQIPL